jgi:hypothetical protein
MRCRSLGALLGSIGIALAASGLTLWFVWARPRTVELNQAVLGIFVHVLFGYVIIMSAIVLLQRESPATECFLATKWCLGGAIFMSALAVWGRSRNSVPGRLPSARFRSFSSSAPPVPLRAS